MIDPRWQPEPRIGHTRTAAGVTWRKVRRLGHTVWGRALAEAIAEVRIAEACGRAVDVGVVAGMGYERVGT